MRPKTAKCSAHSSSARSESSESMINDGGHFESTLKSVLKLTPIRMSRLLSPTSIGMNTVCRAVIVTLTNIPSYNTGKRSIGANDYPESAAVFDPIEYAWNF